MSSLYVHMIEKLFVFLTKAQTAQPTAEGVTLVTNMVINMFVPAGVTIAKLFVTSLKRSDRPRALDHSGPLDVGLDSFPIRRFPMFDFGWKTT